MTMNDERFLAVMREEVERAALENGGDMEQTGEIRLSTVIQLIEIAEKASQGRASAFD